MNCQDARPWLQSYADGELDAVRHVEIEEHVKGCPACTGQESNLRSLKVALAAPGLYYRAPKALRAKVELAANKPYSLRRSRIVPLAVIAAAASLAAAILLLVVLRDRSSSEDRLVAAVVASHVRSLQAEHLRDVVSTDQHSVKPWFSGKLDFSPDVRDFASQGYPLTGGRLDYLADRAVAALVYQRRAHIINLFTWPADREDAGIRAFSRQGYHIRCWQRAGMNYWVISDVNQQDLDEFVGLLQGQVQKPTR